MFVVVSNNKLYRPKGMHVGAHWCECKIAPSLVDPVHGNKQIHLLDITDVGFGLVT